MPVVGGVDIRLERNLHVRWWHSILVPVGSVLVALFVGGVFLVLTDREPDVVYRELPIPHAVEPGFLRELAPWVAAATGGRSRTPGPGGPAHEG